MPEFPDVTVDFIFPEGVTVDFKIYVWSDALRCGSCITAGGGRAFRPDRIQDSIRMAIDTVNGVMGVTDGRLMTAAEIQDFEGGYRDGDSVDDTASG